MPRKISKKKKSTVIGKRSHVQTVKVNVRVGAPKAGAPGAPGGGGGSGGGGGAGGAGAAGMYSAPPPLPRAWGWSEVLEPPRAVRVPQAPIEAVAVERGGEFLSGGVGLGAGAGAGEGEAGEAAGAEVPAAVAPAGPMIVEVESPPLPLPNPALAEELVSGAMRRANSGIVNAVANNSSNSLAVRGGAAAGASADAGPLVPFGPERPPAEGEAPTKMRRTGAAAPGYESGVAAITSVQWAAENGYSEAEFKRALESLKTKPLKLGAEQEDFRARLEKARQKNQRDIERAERRSRLASGEPVEESKNETILAESKQGEGEFSLVSRQPSLAPTMVLQQSNYMPVSTPTRPLMTIPAMAAISAIGGDVLPASGRLFHGVQAIIERQARASASSNPSINRQLFLENGPEPSPADSRAIVVAPSVNSQLSIYSPLPPQSESERQQLSGRELLKEVKARGGEPEEWALAPWRRPEPTLPTEKRSGKVVRARGGAAAAEAESAIVPYTKAGRPTRARKSKNL